MNEAISPRPRSAILEEWFVLYNPFYLASACLTLSGAWQLSVGIAELQWRDGRVVPAMILGVYQILLAGGAIVIARRGSVRPAVILALVGSLFAVDPTFQNVLIALHAGRGVGLTMAAASLAIVMAMAAALPRALRIRFTRPWLCLVFLTIAGIAIGPHVLDAVADRQDAFLFLMIYGAAIAVVMRRSQLEITTEDSDAWTATVAGRCSQYLSILWPAAYAAHAIAWARVFDISADPRVFVMLALMVALGARSEGMVWLGTVVGMVVATVEPRSFSVVALLFALLLVIRWWMGMSHRLAVGAVLEAWIAASTWSGSRLGAMDAGVVLLVSGFALLGAGVAVSLYLTATKPPP